MNKLVVNLIIYLGLSGSDLGGTFFHSGRFSRGFLGGGTGSGWDSLLGALGLVHLDVEGNEQEQVTSQDQVAVGSSQFGTVTVTNVWQRWEVSEGIVGVSSKVNKHQVDQELNDLESGDPFLPPHSDTSSTQEVVEVHDNMDGQVQSDWDPFNGGGTSQLSVTQQGSGTMVVGVQKQQLLLLQHQENGIDQLEVLCQVV